MRNSRVEWGKPSRFAAPFGPETRPCEARNAASMTSRSRTSSCPGLCAISDFWHEACKRREALIHMSSISGAWRRNLRAPPWMALLKPKQTQEIAMAEYSLKRCASTVRFARPGYAALAVVALALCGAGPRAQTPPVPATTDKRIMKILSRTSPLVRRITEVTKNINGKAKHSERFSPIPNNERKRHEQPNQTNPQWLSHTDTAPGRERGQQGH